VPRIVDPSTIRKGPGTANQNSVDANSFTDEVVDGQGQALAAHVNDPQDAHPASAISTTGSGGQFDGDDVQENLDELSALVPTRPPTVGNWSRVLAFSGITDWGSLKLLDGGFVDRGDVTPPDPNNPTNDFFVYGEFWWPPFETQNISSSPNPPGDVFTIPGNDPATDPTFNIDPAGTGDPTYTGGGPGTTHQGGFTRSQPVIETARILAQGPGGPVVVSGSLYPGDRGVVALFHWPAGGDVAAFLAQPLGDRVIAALLCGQGVNDQCDGDPGGIFSEGAPDVFAFPGRASGQFDLVELHSGVDGQTGDLIPPGPDPAAGQVRLGTDPLAGPVILNGIPILGGTTIARGGGNDNNYFRYRLPYLDDYSSTTGIAFTPDIQKPRYFQKPVVSVAAGTDLSQAGDFADFPKNYWTFQVARYRHRFLLDSPPDDQGSYLLLHFRREADFEAFARDGIMPDDVGFGYELWSAEMVNYANPESTDNLIDVSDPSEPITSGAYHVHRSATFEDPDTTPTSTALTYTYQVEQDEVMFCSGVQYFLPNGSGAGTNWQIDTLNWSVSNLWANSYVLGTGVGATYVTPGLWHRVPAILYLGIGTASTQILDGSGPGFDGFSVYQRMDFPYSSLGSVSGPFDLTNGPQPGDSADIVLTGVDTPVRFNGDDAQCHFWFDGRVRMFGRKPLGSDTPTTPATTFLFPNPGLDQILIHTTSHAPSYASQGVYGNFKTGPGDNPPRPTLEDQRKDVEERFYDEVYRVAESAMVSLDPTFNVGMGVGNLVGPGLPFPASTIELPVRFASEALVAFGFASYLRTDLHLLDLATAPAVANEAQVSGLPDRDPPATEGAENPCPFSGMLIYPQVDYTSGFRPSVADGDVTTPQPDYNVVADPERVYIRVFDAAYSNDANQENGVVGQNLLTFRIDGLERSDFAYWPPGPGSPWIAIEVKIPGLTTWMDMGRADGGGPSKQDPLADGAGCQVFGSSVSFDGRDATTGTVYAQVRINVGPAANVFANTGAVAVAGVAPVMVRVRIKQAGTALNFTQGGPSAPTNVPRALTGITLLRHSDGLGPNDSWPYGPPSPFVP